MTQPAPGPGRHPITIQEFDAIYSGPDTCPIHDFTRPCPSCEMVAIAAGVGEAAKSAG